MQPWLAGFDSALCEAVLATVAAGGDALPMLNGALNHRSNAQGLPTHFVPQATLPAGVAYEQFIYDTGGVPTRNLAHSKGAMHDACNALMWLHYPKTKARLNQLQAHVIAAQGVQATRGRLRDALTLFDESALIVTTPAGDVARAQLAQRDWRGLLVNRRAEWGSALNAQVFGHAVLQKLQAPYPAITGQVWCVSGLADTQLSSIDVALAASLGAQLHPEQLLPLPVLGIPGFWAENENPTFYDNVAVFRPLASSAEQQAL